MINLARFARISKSSRHFFLKNGNLAWKTMRLQSEKLLSVLGNLGIQMSKRGAMTAVRVGTVALNGLFVILDISSLVKNIKNGHPTVQAISQLIAKIKDELDYYVELRNAIQDYFKELDSEDGFNSKYCADFGDLNDLNSRE